MDAELFQKVASLFDALRDLSPDERLSYLERHPEGHPAVVEEVRGLLREHDRAGDRDEETILKHGRRMRDALLGGKPSGEDAPEGDVPQHVGRYRIDGEIARGGVGAVLRAKDEAIGREIALKIIQGRYAESDLARLRFVEEGQISGQLQHPGIVPVHEIGVADDGRPYLTMKLVEGRTLADLLGERLDPTGDRQRFLAIFSSVCQAMAYAHSRGVIHRDLKPLNLMVGAFGEVQVMDWGLAKVLAHRPAAGRPADAAQDCDVSRSVRTRREHDAPDLSLAGRVMGTPAYMAPEQARGELERIDERADVFGLGAILCEILTGKPPFVGGTTAEVFRLARAADLEATLRRLETCGAESELVALARRCLAPDPDGRPRDAGVVSGLVTEHLQSLDERSRRAALEAAEARVRVEGERKARRLTTVLAALVSILVLGGAALYVGLEGSRRERLRVAEGRVRQAMLEAEALRAEAGSGGARDPSRWEAARVAALAAADLFDRGMDPGLERRVTQLQRDVETRLRAVRFLEELESIYLDYRHVDTFDKRPAEDAYHKAFARYLGVEDPLSMDEKEFVRVIAKTGYAVEIGMALDQWAFLIRQRDPAAGTLRQLSRLASRIDPDPWRNRLREIPESLSPSDLRELALSPEATESPARSQLLLAQHLLFADDLEMLTRVLRRAQERFPDHFHINYDLGMALVRSRDPTIAAEAPGYLLAALALRPRSVSVLSALSHVHLHLGRLDRALHYSGEAVRLAPELPLALTFRGRALFLAGDLEGAEAAFSKALSGTPESHAAYPDVAIWLGFTRLDRGDPAGAVALVRKALAVDPTAAGIIGSFLPRQGRNGPMLSAAEESVRGAGRSDPHAWFALAAVQRSLDLRKPTVLSLEEALRLAPESDHVMRALSRARDALEEDLVSFASIDAAVERLPAELDLERSRAALPEPADGDSALGAYLRARLLQRASHHEEAIAGLREVLRSDRSAPEPYIALHRSVVEVEPPGRVKPRYRELLRELPPPSFLLPIPPEAPVARGVKEDAGALVLHTGPFEHVDPRVAHAATRWMVRRADAASDRNPVLDRLSTRSLTSLELPRGLLESHAVYSWKVAAIDSGGRPSAWSEEVRLVVGETGLEPVRLDLSAVFDADVVAAPEDPIDDLFDEKNGFRLLVDGYGDTRGSGVKPAGLPADRRVGVHRLGDYSGPNALRLGPDREQPVTLPIAPGVYELLRFVVAGSNGDSLARLEVRHADGSIETMALPCEDWFDDVEDGQVPPDSPASPICNGMDRMGARFPEIRKDAALFEVLVPLDGESAVTGLTLSPEPGGYAEPASRLFLFAVTGMRRVTPSSGDPGR